MSRIMKRLREFRPPSFSFKLSNSYLAFVLVVLTIFILGGGVYDIMEQPISVLPTPSSPIFYYRGMTDQTLNESIIFILFLVIGVSGGYVSFRSTLRAYRPGEARMLIVIGMAMMIIAFIGCEVVLSWKGL